MPEMRIDLLPAGCWHRGRNSNEKKRVRFFKRLLSRVEGINLATEQGIVVKVSSTGAIVKTLRSEACESCSAKHSCSSQGNDMEVEAVNRVGAKEGDRVVLEIKNSPFLKATFLLYVFPVLCMILGAVLGEKFAPEFEMDGNTLSVLFAFIFFFFSIWVVKTKGEKMGKREAYHPTIIRILKLR